MSLRGYGTTFEEALDALHRAIEAQVSFAVQHDTLEQVFIPADPHYFKLYADMKREALKRKLLHREQPVLPDYRVGDILLPAARLAPLDRWRPALTASCAAQNGSTMSLREYIQRFRRPDQ